jgi:NAD+ kinase
MVLEASVHRRQAGDAFHHVAINDVCAIAGEPFRMIDMEVRINSQILARISGDGLVLSTPTGSTAYNMSLGGPILLPHVKGVVVCPIAPHSLAFRPIVVACDWEIAVRMLKVNSGTRLLVDGQLSTPLAEGDVVELRRYERDFRLVRNPAVAPWDTLVTKLGWGRRPRYNHKT